jgi:hypothetical protein
MQRVSLPTPERFATAVAKDIVRFGGSILVIPTAQPPA